ncbi:MAG: tetratricopeptide repeat protein [Acidobacteria bacterium]|nr:tetratricopeptide repeat protein [Acidobacteriota bacterium]
MPTRYIAISVISVFLSFIGGFLVANALNRSEVASLQSKLQKSTADPAAANNSANESTLSDDEIRAKIAEADATPDNFAFQRDLGLGLYRYAAMQQDTALLRESSRLLERALGLNPNDYQIKVALGNSHFDVGYFEKKNEPFVEARKYYRLALDARPNDVEVRTDYALTYFLQSPPDNTNAIKEFEAVLRDNPKQEKALQFLTRAYWQAGQGERASVTLQQLRQANPGSPVVKELESLLLQPPAAAQ